MKRLYFLVLATAMIATTACGAKKEAITETVSVKVTTQAEDDVEVNVNEETQEASEPSESQAETQGDESEDLKAFAGSIAQGFSDSYGFDAAGEYTEADGIVITITAEGSSQWLDHAWDEMIDSINESYNESASTMNRAGTGDTSLTYLVCDTDGVSYLRYVNGEVEDLANGSRQSVQ